MTANFMKKKNSIFIYYDNMIPMVGFMPGGRAGRQESR
jgi:hypothetical protein